MCFFYLILFLDNAHLVMLLDTQIDLSHCHLLNTHVFPAKALNTKTKWHRKNRFGVIVP